MSAQIKIDPETGEIINHELTVVIDNAPSISLDVSKVAEYHNNPKGLAAIIKDQAGFAVFDIGSKKGREACASHAAKIIRCITPAAKESQRLAEEAKKVTKQDLAFRNEFEKEIRAIAAAVRAPLTEYEEFVAAQAEIERLAEEARLAEIQYLSAWQEAIDYDELFTLRREKAEAEAEKLRLERKLDQANKTAFAKENADGYQALFADMRELRERPIEEFKVIVLSRVAKQKANNEEKTEALRLKIQQEEEAKALAKVKLEQAEIEHKRLEALKVTDIPSYEIEFNPDFEPEVTAENLHQSIDTILEEPTMFGYSAGDVALGLAFWERVDDINNAKALIIWAAGELQKVKGDL